MNWTKLIAALTKRYGTQKAVAGLAGCSQASLSDLARGKTTDPTWSLGDKLLRMKAKADAAGKVAAKARAAKRAKAVAAKDVRR